MHEDSIDLRIDDKKCRKIFKYLCKYLELDICENNLLNILKGINFNIYTIDTTLKSLDKLIKENITYKQRIYNLVYYNIISDKNMNVFLLYVSLLFDDFSDMYFDIRDDGYFHVRLLGLFINLDKAELVLYINKVLNEEFISHSLFYFLIDFLHNFIDFQFIVQYLSSILYRYNKNFYNTTISDHLSEIIYRIFKINYLFDDVWLEYRYLFIENKEVILIILEYLSNYIYFMDRSKINYDKFDFNLGIIYNLLQYLCNTKLTIKDYETCLYLYINIIIRYRDCKKSILCNIESSIRCLLSPILRNYGHEKISNISSITISYLNKENYIDHLYSISKKSFISSSDIMHVLTLIYSESDSMKEYIINFVDRFDIDFFKSYSYKELNTIISYLITVVNCIIENSLDISGLNNVIELILTYSNEELYDLNYKLLRNIIMRCCPEVNLSFEGVSFYSRIKNFNKILQDKLDREYLYARYIFVDKSSECNEEKQNIVDYISEYFRSIPEDRYRFRDRYYKYLINTKYFDLYKFEILEYFKKIDYDELLNECNFLIYNSTDEQAFKLGIVLSLNFCECIYEDVYKKSIRVLSWGDIFYEIYIRYKILYNESINHKSYNFLIRFKFRQNYAYRHFKNLRDRNKIIVKDIQYIMNNYVYKLNSNIFIYSILFSDYDFDKHDSINILTLKLKVLIKLIKGELSYKILEDRNLYNKLRFYLRLYCRRFISFTQFKVLDELRQAIKISTYDNQEIINKGIETEYNNKDNKLVYDMNSIYITRWIDEIMNSDLANNYFKSMFYSEDIGFIIEIMDNEDSFYNRELNLFYNYIRNYNIYALNEIYQVSVTNCVIAKTFIRILSYYPEVLLFTLNNNETLIVYKKIVDIIRY